MYKDIFISFGMLENGEWMGYLFQIEFLYQLPTNGSVVIGHPFMGLTRLFVTY